MYVTSGHDAEVRLTLEAMVDLVNAFHDSETASVDVRSVLAEHSFTRAAAASDASITRTRRALESMLPTMRSLPDADVDAVVPWINDQLTDIDITPSMTAHDGAGLHIHWTPATATFDQQVVADILMALAQEVCDHGTTRFGICAASDCDHLFYDATRNGSRRFCSDPRCASRTHTADHRARRRSS